MTMQLIRYPEKKDWQKITARPVLDMSSLEAAVSEIIRDVKRSGDEAVQRFTRLFDKVSVEQLSVTAQEIEDAGSLIPEVLKAAISQAKKNIETFHAAQLGEKQVIETMPGVKCWRKNVPIEKVGLYIPGGTAPLFSTLLMLAIPA